MKLEFSFVPFPREVWTENIDLTQAEFRLLGWFCCNLKFGLPQPEITDKQILDGFKNGDATYPPSGLSKNSLRRAREGLVAKEFLSARKKSDGGGRSNEALWVYYLNLPNSDKFRELNPPNLDHKPSQLGHVSPPFLTINPPNLDTHKGIERSNTERTDINIKHVRVAHHACPSLLEVKLYCQERQNTVDPEKWFDYYSANGWRVGRNPMKDWRAAVRTWEKNGFNGNGKASKRNADHEAIERVLEEVYGPDDDDTSGGLFKLPSA